MTTTEHEEFCGDNESNFLEFSYPSTYGISSRPWWSGLFHSSSPSSTFLPNEREIFPEWFEADEAEDCEAVPETVNTGRPMDLCGNVSRIAVEALADCSWCLKHYS